ncbi:50S ribosomal protein L5 [Candidatus Woesearchaeota archaeon]|nr:50S ribosomal protein L5 [Candidatus Woesearchaeota archaeon]
MNKMEEVRIEKVTLNIGAGKDQNKLEKGLSLIKSITGIPPVKTITNKRIMGWGLRPGLPIGCKVTLRKKPAMDIIPRLLHAKDNLLTERNFDNSGNVSFGIPEYIDIKDAKYDAKIGVMGLEVCITFEKAGYRVKKRKIRRTQIGKNHTVTKEEAIKFMKNNFNVKIGEEE